MMRQQQGVASQFGKYGVACIASRSLQSRSGGGINRNTAGDERHPQAATIVAAELSPGIGIGRQAVMNVDGLQALAQPQRHQGMQQDDGIAATGEADRQAPFRIEAGGEKGADPLREVS